MFSLAEKAAILSNFEFARTPKAKKFAGIWDVTIPLTFAIEFGHVSTNGLTALGETSIEDCFDDFVKTFDVDTSVSAWEIAKTIR